MCVCASFSGYISYEPKTLNSLLKECASRSYVSYCNKWIGFEKKNQKKVCIYECNMDYNVKHVKKGTTMPRRKNRQNMSESIFVGFGERSMESIRLHSDYSQQIHTSKFATCNQLTTHWLLAVYCCLVLFSVLSDPVLLNKYGVDYLFLVTLWSKQETTTAPADDWKW